MVTEIKLIELRARAAYSSFHKQVGGDESVGQDTLWCPHQLTLLAKDCFGYCTDERGSQREKGWGPHLRKKGHSYKWYICK